MAKDKPLAKKSLKPEQEKLLSTFREFPLLNLSESFKQSGVLSSSYYYWLHNDERFLEEYRLLRKSRRVGRMLKVDDVVMSEAEQGNLKACELAYKVEKEIGNEAPQVQAISLVIDIDIFPKEQTVEAVGVVRADPQAEGSA